MNFMKNLEPLRVELRSKSALLLNTMPPPTSCSGTGNCGCKPEIEFSTILSVMSSRTIFHGQILTCPT